MIEHKLSENKILNFFYKLTNFVFPLFISCIISSSSKRSLKVQSGFFSFSSIAWEVMYILKNPQKLEMLLYQLKLSFLLIQTIRKHICKFILNIVFFNFIKLIIFMIQLQQYK